MAPSATAANRHEAGAISTKAAVAGRAGPSAKWPYASDDPAAISNVTVCKAARIEGRQDSDIARPVSSAANGEHTQTANRSGWGLLRLLQNYSLVA